MHDGVWNKNTEEPDALNKLAETVEIGKFRSYSV